MVKKILFAAAIFFLILFCLLPFIQMLSVSFKYAWDWGNPSLLPVRVNSEAYGELLIRNKNIREPSPIMYHLLKDAEIPPTQQNRILNRYREASEIFPFALYFRNSLLLSFLSAFWATLLASMGAYALGRLRMNGKKLINRLIILVYLIGGVLVVVPLFRMASSLGLLSTSAGTAAALLCIYLVQVLPVALYLLGNFFRAIPVSLDEAGLIDGLTHWGALFRIIIPLSRNALTTVFIYCFIIVWNDYLFASVFLKSHPDFYTLSLGLRFLYFSKNAIWDRIMAASVLTAFPVVILFWTIQRNLEQGFTGGIKE